MRGLGEKSREENPMHSHSFSLFLRLLLQYFTHSFFPVSLLHRLFIPLLVSISCAFSSSQLSFLHSSMPVKHSWKEDGIGWLTHSCFSLKLVRCLILLDSVVTVHYHQLVTNMQREPEVFHLKPIQHVCLTDTCWFGGVNKQLDAFRQSSCLLFFLL